MKTKSKAKYEAQVSAKQIDASIKLVEKAAGAFTHVTRLTALEKRRSAKFKRGAHQVIPTIAHIARKFAIEAPGQSVDDMMSKIAHAQSLEPLLGVVANLHAALKDEYFGTQSEVWKTATLTYGMLRQAALADAGIRTELEPVLRWFRHHLRSRANDTAANVNGAATPATPGVGT